jgi:integrase
MKAATLEGKGPEVGQLIGQLKNVISLPTERKEPRIIVSGHFVVKEYENASGSLSYRVDGYKRDRTRIRENYAEEKRARTRQIELETEWLQGEARTEIQATKLTREQISLAEAAFIRLGPGAELELTLAVEHWIRTGRQAPVESPRLDDAVTKFKAWLDTSDFRDRTKDNLRNRINVFANSVPNPRVAEITPDTIYSYLEKRAVAKASKDNDRRALSRFFAFCMERGRKWIATNPARKETRERRANGSTPSVLSVSECKVLIQAAEQHRGGRLAPYVALCLFGGLRPFEAARLSLEQINLKDGEIRIEPDQTKTKTGRVVTVGPTLKAWLEAYKGKPLYPANWRRDFDLIKAAAGYGNPKRLPKHIAESRKQWREWPEDVLRHTGISHFFRNCGSFGLTAEWAGNSEAIIKRHYKGLVSSEDTKAFYALMPKKGGSK